MNKNTLIHEDPVESYNYIIFLLSIGVSWCLNPLKFDLKLVLPKCVVLHQISPWGSLLHIINCLTQAEPNCVKLNRLKLFTRRLSTIIQYFILWTQNTSCFVSIVEV